jgi:hypothetical protein
MVTIKARTRAIYVRDRMLNSPALDPCSILGLRIILSVRTAGYELKIELRRWWSMNDIDPEQRSYCGLNVATIAVQISDAPIVKVAALVPGEKSI